MDQQSSGSSPVPPVIPQATASTPIAAQRVTSPSGEILCTANPTPAPLAPTQFNPFLSISRRTRRTPYTDRVMAHGVTAYTVYNHMLLPTVFDSLERDYHHLKTAVQVWDVSCQRQISVWGPDAARLMQMLTPRDLERLVVGQCMYVPMVDYQGGMLNDPVAVKLAEDWFWVSIADSDLSLWIKAIASAWQLNINVSEPDVFPLAVQGPAAPELMARVFGDAVRDLRFFRFERLAFEGHEFVVARSGYSKQGGFEIYMDNWELGEPLWDALFSAGEDLNVRPGCPNLIERVEGGLLSYGNDMNQANTPFECGLGRFCQVQTVESCIGRDALLRGADRGPERQIRSIAIDGGPQPPTTCAWPVYADGNWAGQVTSATWSPDYDTMAAIGMIEMEHWDGGTRVEVETPVGMRWATVLKKSFI